MTAALLRLNTATDDERRMIDHLVEQLVMRVAKNREAEEYYDGSHFTRTFGISIPPEMEMLRTVSGWPGTVVDVLEERLDWTGWKSTGDDDYGLSSVYAANSLDSDSGSAHLDALIFGVSFVTVGSGFAGEPDPLVTVQSPNEMTGDWDGRLRRLSSAISVKRDDTFDISGVTLYGPGETVVFEKVRGVWVTQERDRHNLGRVPVVLVANRSRVSQRFGRSEITRAVRYLTDAASRTMQGLEVNREFYNAPQRAALGVDQSMFQNPDGSPADPWKAIQGRIWAIPPNDDGTPIDVKQFPASSPAPYIDQVHGYAQLLAAEAGIPEAYLGMGTSNPASADAIRSLEARLVKRATRRQTVFGKSWMEVARLALLVRDGAVPDRFDTEIRPTWVDAATPTRAAAADEATKLIASGVLPADSSVTYDRIGLSPAEQRQLDADKRRSAGSDLLARLMPDADQG